MWCVSIAFSAHARSKLAKPSLPMSPWGLLQSSNAARDGGRSRRGENKPRSLRTQTQTPANLFSLKKDGNKWKALKRHGQPHLREPRRILLDNCIMGTRGRVSFRVTVGKSTGRGQVPGLMPQGDRCSAGKVQCLSCSHSCWVPPPGPWC